MRSEINSHGIPSLDSGYSLNNDTDLFMVQEMVATTNGVGMEKRGDGRASINIGTKRSLLAKHIGLVDQIVAAAGRVFIGTSLSTYTSYIQRLRGYLGTTRKIKDLSCYYHNKMNEAPFPDNAPPTRCRGLVGNDASLWRRQE